MGLINNSIKSFIWNVLGAGIGFIFQMIAARLLGAEKFGQANYLLGYVATITVFTSFGLQTYLPKYISKNNSKKLFSDIFWTYTSLFIIANIGIVLIFYGIKIKTINIIIISILSYLTTLSEIILIYNISSGKAVLGMFNRKFLYSTLNLIIFVLSFIALSNKYYIYVGTMIISYIITTIPFIVKNVSKIKVNFLIIKNSIGFYA
ncbi:hypothetical protein SDC9_157585 [bioreactor metagenome]|uniref:Polysaccharide biosynthesis protein C-terminal domain-containing protein n=1 Tax=bioreactor metagenome TaxID=1076179 RepID=A0A645F8Q6_9ZZZZ